MRLLALAWLGLTVASLGCSRDPTVTERADAGPTRERTAATAWSAHANPGPSAGRSPSAGPSPSASGSRRRGEPPLWSVFEPYPGARPLCELRGTVPHTFVRVFASRDEAEVVERFYRDGRDRGMRHRLTPEGVVLSNDLDGEPQLEIATVHGGLPEGCVPAAGEQSLLLVTVWPGRRR